MATQEADQVGDVPPLSLERSKSVKRMAQDEQEDEYQKEELKKGPRLSHPSIDAIQISHMIMNVLEKEECKIVQVEIDDYCMPSLPLTIIEESLDYSWAEEESTRLLGEMVSCTDVGPLRDRLGEKLLQSLGEEFIDPGTGESIPAGTGEESIFDYDSSMGRLPELGGDYLGLRRCGVDLDEDDQCSSEALLPSQ